MLFCCVAVAVVIGVGLQNGGLGQFRLDQVLNPVVGDDVGAVGFSGVELNPHFPRQVPQDPGGDPPQALWGEVFGEVDHGLGAAAVLLGDILFPVGSGGRLLVGHTVVLLCKISAGAGRFLG